MVMTRTRAPRTTVEPQTTAKPQEAAVTATEPAPQASKAIGATVTYQGKTAKVLKIKGNGVIDLELPGGDRVNNVSQGGAHGWS